MGSHRLDWLAVGPVSRQLLSASNSLPTGKNTGNILKSMVSSVGLFSENPYPERLVT